MSDFKSKALFEQITEGRKGMDEKEKKDIQKKVRSSWTSLLDGVLGRFRSRLVRRPIAVRCVGDCAWPLEAAVTPHAMSMQSNVGDVCLTAMSRQTTSARMNG